MVGLLSLIINIPLAFKQQLCQEGIADMYDASVVRQLMLL